MHEFYIYIISTISSPSSNFFPPLPTHFQIYDLFFLYCFYTDTCTHVFDHIYSSHPTFVSFQVPLITFPTL